MSNLDETRFASVIIASTRSLAAASRRGDVPRCSLSRTRKSDSNPRKELVRNQLIDKAADLFSKRGFSRTTINDIAEELGLRRSSLYHYFRNKEQILQAMIEDQTVAPSQLLKKLMDDTSLSPLERLEHAFRLSVMRKLADAARFRVLDQIEFEMPEDLAAEHKRNKRRVLELWSRLISDGVAAGALRNVDSRMAAFSILGMVNWTAWWYSATGEMTPQQIAQAITDIGIFGLARGAHDRAAPNTLGAAIKNLKADIAQLEQLAR
jgi:AcrR family transcriptional regulator